MAKQKIGLHFLTDSFVSFLDILNLKFLRSIASCCKPQSPCKTFEWQYQGQIDEYQGLLININWILP